MSPQESSNCTAASPEYSNKHEAKIMNLKPTL